MPQQRPRIVAFRTNQEEFDALHDRAALQGTTLSELIRQQGHATFMFDPVAINNRHVTGVETIMWGNDYPHPEGTWPTSQEIAAKQFADVPDDEVRAIVGGTAASVFGFELA